MVSITAILIYVTAMHLALAQEGFRMDDLLNRKQQCNPFKCPKGEEAVPKRPLKLTSQGCSGMGGKTSSFSKPKEGDKILESCCDQRIACLQLCGASKNACDDEFKACTNLACGSIEDTEEQKSCNSNANVHTLMSSLSGCKTFDEEQSKACQCVKTEKASKRREQSLSDFYKKYAPESVDKVSGLVEKANSSKKMAGLMSKLVKKYPESIKKIKDPTQQMMEEFWKRSEEEGVDVNTPIEGVEKVLHRKSPSARSEEDFSEANVDHIEL